MNVVAVSIVCLLILVIAVVMVGLVVAKRRAPRVGRRARPRRVLGYIAGIVALLFAGLAVTAAQIYRYHSLTSPVPAAAIGGGYTEMPVAPGNTTQPYLFTAQDLRGADPYKACMGIDADWHSKRVISRQLFALLDRSNQDLLAGFLKEQNPTADQKNDIVAAVCDALNTLVQGEDKEAGIRKVLSKHIPKVRPASMVQWERLPDGRYYIHKWIISALYPFQLVAYRLPEPPEKSNVAPDGGEPTAREGQAALSPVLQGQALPWIPRTEKARPVTTKRPIRASKIRPRLIAYKPTGRRMEQKHLGPRRAQATHHNRRVRTNRNKPESTNAQGHLHGSPRG